MQISGSNIIIEGVNPLEKRVFKTLSIVVPVYNEDRYLESVISKVIAQPLPGGLERELILINDASSDNTWNIMQSLPDKFPGI
ncbi:MAG: glycosyltransferase [Comamonadaceae bacterium]|nr:glycosyltransferase [Comamonadaceae bacterium]